MGDHGSDARVLVKGAVLLAVVIIVVVAFWAKVGLRYRDVKLRERIERRAGIDRLQEVAINLGKLTLRGIKNN